MHLYGVETFNLILYPLSKWGKIAVWLKDHLKSLIPENSVTVFFFWIHKFGDKTLILNNPAERSF